MSSLDGWSMILGKDTCSFHTFVFVFFLFQNKYCKDLTKHTQTSGYFFPIFLSTFFRNGFQGIVSKFKLSHGKSSPSKISLYRCLRFLYLSSRYMCGPL
ncbi:unnamed protein product [Nezara viridula]|uniref:Uncharacterized protein n=1 Tax=Nezara viridula TaxID=85310 RepID=A0A9P0H2I6_NEZVI|nr:unnamed protein product [Nezara viridula]